MPGIKIPRLKKIPNLGDKNPETKSAPLDVVGSFSSWALLRNIPGISRKMKSRSPGFRDFRDFALGFFAGIPKNPILKPTLVGTSHLTGKNPQNPDSREFPALYFSDKIPESSPTRLAICVFLISICREFLSGFPGVRFLISGIFLFSGFPDFSREKFGILDKSRRHL